MKDLEIIRVNDINYLKQCLDIRKTVFIEEQGISKKIERDQYDTLNNDCTHFLIKYKNINIGTIRCLIYESDIIKIQRFCFLKEYRKLGLGKKVLQYIEDYYKKEKSIIELDSQYQVYKFYKKCGYIENSNPFIEANIKHIKMIKNI